MRENSLVDQMIHRFDKILQALPKNISPTKTIAHEATSAALMRINHSGEVCAQALYLGQAFVARDKKLADQLYLAAEEEQTHLTWCRERIAELNGQTSFLNPVWAVGSFGIGIIAGLAGDKISLGFLAETENQVTNHLEKHLHKISPDDKKSIAILQKMRDDEKKHATHAIALGGVALPKSVCKIMAFCSKIMTTLARYI